MALTITPLMIDNPFEYDEERDEIKVSIPYACKGSEVAVNDGTVIAANDSFFPDIGDTLLPTDCPQTLTLTNKRGVRVGPEYCKVFLEYIWKRDGLEIPKKPEKEVDRSKLYGVPYNERLEMAGQEITQQLEIDDDGNYTGKTIGFKGEGATVYEPRVIWSFTVLSRPKQAFWNNIGSFNELIYPPGWNPADHTRPFYFNDETLMYLGCSGDMADRDEVRDPGDIPFDWVWKFNFQFAFNPIGWKYAYWSASQELGPKAATDDFYYEDPFVGGEVQADLKRGATVRLYKKVGGEKQFFWNGQVRQPKDFATDFGFDWDS